MTHNTNFQTKRNQEVEGTTQMPLQKVAHSSEKKKKNTLRIKGVSTLKGSLQVNFVGPTVETSISSNMCFSGSRPSALSISWGSAETAGAQDVPWSTQAIFSLRGMLGLSTP